MKAHEVMISVKAINLAAADGLKLDLTEYRDVNQVPVTDEEQKYIGTVDKECLLIEMHENGLLSKDWLMKALNSTTPCVRTCDEIETITNIQAETVIVDYEDHVKGIITSSMGTLMKSIYGLKRFESIIDATPNGIMVVDNTGVIQVANQTVCELLRVEKADMIGHDVLEFIPQSLLPRVLNIQQPLLGQKTLVGNVNVITNIAPIIRCGKTVGAVSVFQDISILEKAALEFEKVKNIMREFESIFNSSYDGLTLLDANGVMLRVNGAYERITGIQGTEVIGKNMQDLISQGYYDQSVALKVIEKKERVTINQVIKGNRVILVTGSPAFDEGGNLANVVVNNRDITELADLRNEITKSREENNRFRSEITHLRSLQLGTGNIIFRSLSMEHATETAQTVANVDSTVLITGESGTGKELIAKLIHGAGKGIDKPFIKINCAAVPESLLESELFGYEQGSFTGAKKEGKPGLFELAHNGTLFLDEIGDMPFLLQVKILRVLQEKEVMRVGGIKPISIDVRIVAATHRDLTKMVDDGQFRADLYYRLMVVPIHLSPLRERKEDIPILIHYFMDKYNKKFNFDKSISSSTVDQLVAYQWKGNVRELENVIERMIVTSKVDELTVDHLPEFILARTIIDKKSKLKAAVEQTETFLLAEAYKECRSWDDVGKRLGIDRATTYRKARKYKLFAK